MNRLKVVIGPPRPVDPADETAKELLRILNIAVFCERAALHSGATCSAGTLGKFAPRLRQGNELLPPLCVGRLGGLPFGFYRAPQVIRHFVHSQVTPFADGELLSLSRRSRSG